MRIHALLLTFLMAFPVAAHAVGQDAAPPAAQVKPAPSAKDGAQADATEDYICPMHREVHGKKGEKCRICHMPLVPAHPAEAPMTPVPETPETKNEGDKQ